MTVEPRAPRPAEIGLDGFTFPDHSAQAVIDVAADAGYRWAGIRLIDPVTNAPTLTLDDARAHAHHARDRGITLYGADIVNLEGPRTHWHEGMSVAAAAGITRVSAIARGEVSAQTREAFAALAAAARPHGITVHVEPVSYFGVRTIADVVDLIADSVGGITIDTLQFSRADDDLALLSEVAATMPIWLQVCDGPPHDSLWTHAATPDERVAALRHESVADRLLPGEGACPVDVIVRTVHAARRDEPLVAMVEAPAQTRTAELGPHEYARAAHHATTQLLRRMQ